MSTNSSGISCVRNEALRVAYIDVVENMKDGNYTEYYSKLVKADIHGKDKVCHVQLSCGYEL